MSLGREKYFDQPVFNAGSEEIPGFAVLEIKAPGFRTHKDKEYFDVGKPTKDGKAYLINGPFPIPAGKVGGAANPAERVGVHALCDPAISPKTNDVLKPIPGQWWLGKDSGADTSTGGGTGGGFFSTGGTEAATDTPTSTGGSFVVIGDLRGSGPAASGLPASASTKRVRVWLPGTGDDESSESRYGVLVMDIPKAELTFESGAPQIKPGYEPGEAAYPLSWELVGVQDLLTAAKDKDGNTLPALPVLNPIWTTEIKAGADKFKAVIAKGNIETRNVYSAGNPEKKKVFVVESINYPYTIFSGNAQHTVRGEDFLMTVGKVLWGRDPGVTQMLVKNPDAWEADNGAYALAMIMIDGTGYALDLACPEPTEG